MPTPQIRERGFDSPTQEAYLSLWRTYDRLRGYEDELFGRYELTAQQYNALRLLRGVHPETMPTLTLASKLVSRAPDITRLLDHLVEKGWIARERKPENRRVVRVCITDKGLELLQRIQAEVRAMNDQQLGHLSPEQLKELVGLLRLARAPHEPPESNWK
jgi:DNA-binding MarR family transcriptional regulator